MAFDYTTAVTSDRTVAASWAADHTEVITSQVVVDHTEAVNHIGAVDHTMAVASWVTDHSVVVDHIGAVLFIAVAFSLFILLNIIFFR